MTQPQPLRQSGVISGLRLTQVHQIVSSQVTTTRVVDVIVGDVACRSPSAAQPVRRVDDAPLLHPGQDRNTVEALAHPPSLAMME